MWEYLQPHDGPVVEGLEDIETVYAAHQPQYTPLRTLVSPRREGRVMSRWTPTEEQRRLIAAGADIYLTMLTFSEPLQPIQMAIGSVDLDPDWVLGCLLEIPVTLDMPPGYVPASDQGLNQRADQATLRPPRPPRPPRVPGDKEVG